MDELWRGLLDMLKVAGATFFAFLAGELKAQNDQDLVDERQKVKELKTDAKNRDDVGRLSDDDLDRELRDSPKL